MQNFEEVFEEVLDEEFPTKEKSKAVRRKATVRAKKRKDTIKYIDTVRKPKEIKNAWEKGKFKQRKRSNRQLARITLNQITR